MVIVIGPTILVGISRHEETGWCWGMYPAGGHGPGSPAPVAGGSRLADHGGRECIRDDTGCPGRTAAAEPLQRDGEFSMNVGYTVWQTGTTYDVDGWSRPPATWQWSTDTTDAHGNFHFGRYESSEPCESCLVRTAARAGSSVEVST
jgi:hypothetical protein